MRLSTSKLLLLSPHTDDIEYGLGGTLLNLIKPNTEVRWMVFSNAIKSLVDEDPTILIREQKQAAKLLNIETKSLIFYDFPVREFSYQRQAILEELLIMKKKFDPDMVFCPSSLDFHQDHKTIYDETIRAFKDCTILGYNTPWNQFNESNQLLVKLTKKDLEFKKKLLKTYKSQSHRKYMDEKIIETIARYKAIRSNFDFGESFEVISMVCQE